ncbi:response regulator [Chitinivorax sp. B]|uniref:response regulator n=1 Tax=Chitinivorax sp. B TaxID=2502235 RepID=UPI001484DCA0|nr:response regulator [Chitinivorax sp. B]
MPTRPAPQAIIIDDDPISRKLIRAMLAQEGWHVHDNHNNEQALQYHGAHPAQLVLIEISLPGKNGTEVCREMRQQQRHPTKIVAYTHHAQDTDKKAFLANGFDDILIKPITQASLINLLDVLGFR